MALRTALLALMLLGIGVPTWAQQADNHFDHPVVLIGAGYGTPTGLAGTAGILIATPRPLAFGDSPDSARAGLVATGSWGTGGFGVSVGGAALSREGPLLTTGFDGRFTLARTWRAAGSADADSTCVGGEAALVIMSVRLSAGVAHRTAGPAGLKSTIFTWSVGVQVPLGW